MEIEISMESLSNFSCTRAETKTWLAQGPLTSPLQKAREKGTIFPNIIPINLSKYKFDPWINAQQLGNNHDHDNDL